MSALIWCPFPDREAARVLASQLLDEKLIACANIMGEVESLFEWDGERGEGREIGVLFKTDATQLQAATNRIADLHPYETPAVLGWECAAAAPATAAWLGAIARG